MAAQHYLLEMDMIVGRLLVFCRPLGFLANTGTLPEVGRGVSGLSAVLCRRIQNRLEIGPPWGCTMRRED